MISSVSPKLLTVNWIISHAGFDKDRKPFKKKYWATSLENHKASICPECVWERESERRREDISLQTQPFVSPHYREQVCLGLSLWVSLPQSHYSMTWSTPSSTLRASVCICVCMHAKKCVCGLRPLLSAHACTTCPGDHTSPLLWPPV